MGASTLATTVSQSQSPSSVKLSLCSMEGVATYMALSKEAKLEYVRYQDYLTYVVRPIIISES